MTDQTFADLGVAEPICRALADEGYTTPTPIQKGAIPTLLEGRDLLGLAQTGTGKTAAFAVPILQRLAADNRPAKPRTPRTLILSPTRELAVQINDSLKLYGRHTRLRSTAVFGGVGIGAQIETLRRGVDIVVATPGRLLDLVDQRALDLSAIEILTLDEADRMLDMGFVRDVRRIVKLVPKARQTLLLSATMPSDIEHLAAEILKNPVRVEIAHAGKTVDRIAQSVHFVPASSKRDLLATLLADEAMTRVMVFTRTKRGADRVAQHLNRCDISAEAIHGNKSQNNRQRALESFRSGRTRVLVATDIAARGLDIDLVTHVFNFELPHEPEAYVHRIGRTARAGTDGTAIAFCSPDERDDLRAIERLTRRTLEVAVTPAFTVTVSAATDARHDRIDERREARDASLENGRGGNRRRGGGRGPGARGNGDGYRGQSRGEGGRGDGSRNEGGRGEAGRSAGPRDEARASQRPARHGDARRANDAPRSNDAPRGSVARGDARSNDARSFEPQPRKPSAGPVATGGSRNGAAHGKPAAAHVSPAADKRQTRNGAGNRDGARRPATNAATAGGAAANGGPAPWSSWTSRSGNR
ncbi:MAG: DEAD/DEAH box helicase [Hyphomicrobiaceae bacterium]